MSVEENKALVRRYFESGFQEAMRGNLEVCARVKELLSDSGQATPDLRREVVDIAAEDDLVFVHWRATATHEAQHQVHKHVRDIEPTGEEETVSGIILFRIQGGKFVEGWNYHNLLEYALERGKAGAPGGGS